VSSAILYVAIVAIWACVLIPRWLRRGTAAEASEQATEPIPFPSDAQDKTGPARASGPTASDFAAESDEPADEPLQRPAARPRTQQAQTQSQQTRRTQSRRKMLAARRRLLLTLLALETAAIALTALHLTALWILIPPTIMLAGYLLLLREAANADAERTRAADAAAEHARARARAQAREAERERERARRAAQPPARRRIEVPEREDDYDLSGGRDYAPGLAGKYETSGAAGASDASGSGSGSGEVIDFTEYKRAVGD
jgi:hypothetical protein